MVDKEKFMWGKKGDTKLKPLEVHKVTSLVTDEPIKRNKYRPMEFRSAGKQFKKIAGKRYRIPRKAKKEFKKNICKRGWDLKKLKFSYRRLNRDIDGRKGHSQ